MKKILLVLIVLPITLSLFGCSKRVNKVKSSDDLYIRKIENIDDDFIMGMDASSVISLEQSGVKYYDYDGNEEDVFKVLASSGINHIRVRVWNDPYDSNGNGYGGGNCDIEKAIEIGKRASKYGMKLIVDFHYSDFWADPSKQMVPKAWKDLQIEDKAKALYEYTKDSLKQLKKNGVDVGMVQMGNETNNGLAGEKVWMNIIFHLMTSSSKAIREVYPKALIAVHFANPENYDSYLSYAKKLAYYNLDYDVFASSYYPYWHGTLDNLTKLLSEIAETYNKKVMVMETSYAYTGEDLDFFGNTIGDGAAVIKDYPYTIQGQTNHVLNVIDAIANKTTNGIGVCYWEGTWIPVGTSSFEENSLLWEKYGSGWASSYASEYDPKDAGKYYGGCAVDNQAFFDPSGHPLESLKLFELCKKGNEIELYPDAIEDINISFDLNDDIVLPNKVNAIMADNTKQEIDVVWDDFDSEYMKSHGVNKYTIYGNAGGKKACAYVSMIKYNYLNNYSFEEDDHLTKVPKAWDLIEVKNAKQLYVEEKSTDSIDGIKHYHFWSDEENSIEFYLEQEVKDLKEGTYRFEISIMGGDAGEQEIYAYVKLDDKIINSSPLSITSYNNWSNNSVTFDYDGNQKLTVGIYVKCQGSGNGAWGKIDNALLNSEN